MPTTTIPCPRCDRPLKIPEAVLGKRVRCPGCGEVVRTRRVEPVATGATWRFQVRVKRGPAALLKGPILVEVTPRGLVFFKVKAELAQVKAGVGARHEGGNLVATTTDEGDDIAFAVTALTMYQDRLAGEVARFLDGRIEGLNASDFAVSRYLLGVAVLPGMILFAGMAGGAIGGAIGGGLAGALVMVNFAIVRRERWPVAARIAACLGLTAVGTASFVALFVAIVAGVRGGLAPQPTDRAPAMAPDVPPPPLPNPQAPPPATDFPGLLGYWPLDEGDGRKANDGSGRGNHGSITDPRWVEGVRGGALRFDGNGFLDYGDSADFNFAGGQSFTVAGWFRSRDGQGPIVSQRGRAEGAPVVDVVIEGDRVTAVVREDGNESLNYAKLTVRYARDDRWHHFALVRHAGRDVELFVDGRSGHKVAGMSTGGAITTDLRAFGSERRWVATGWAAPHYFPGAIDEVCIFNRDLDPAEIARLAGRP